MAVGGGEGISSTIPAAADLSAGQFRAIVVDSNGRGTFSGAQGTGFVGILQNKPNAQDAAARVKKNGLSKMIAGAAITVGAKVASGVQGFGTVDTNGVGDEILGVARTGCGGSGDIFTIELGSYKN